MPQFSVKMADLEFDIKASHAAQQLCCDYISENSDTIHSISITQEVIEQERQRLRLTPNSGIEDNTRILEGLALCRALSNFLPTKDRVLFHGSSLAIDGNGVLFTAKSGTGKSTHTRLWRQVFGDRVIMINDDKPFLHIRPEGTTVYGTPWRGKHQLGSNISAPLRAVCIICRDEKNSIEQISFREAFPVLLQQTYSPDAPKKLLKTIALVDLLSRTVPVYRLHCNMDPQAAEIAYAGIGLA